MTTLLIADLHLSDNPRDLYRFKTLVEVRKIMRNRKVARIIVVGDITEAKDHHGAWLTNAVVREFDLFAELADVYVMPGNHDYAKAGSPFFRFVERIPGIAWVNNPGFLTLDGLGKCLFLPHTRNHERDWAPFRGTTCNYVFAHQTFANAQGDFGHLLDGIPEAALPCPSAAVYAGDVHRPQTVGRVTYIGAPHLVDYGDDYAPRVILLPEGRGRVESIPLTGSQKRQVEIGWPGTPTIAANPGDMIRVKVKLSKSADYADWPEIRIKVRDFCEGLGYTVDGVIPSTPLHRVKSSRPVTANRSDSDIVKAYAKQQGIDAQTGLALLG